MPACRMVTRDGTRCERLVSRKGTWCGVCKPLAGGTEHLIASPVVTVPPTTAPSTAARDVLAALDNQDTPLEHAPCGWTHCPDCWARTQREQSAAGHQRLLEQLRTPDLTSQTSATSNRMREQDLAFHETVGDLIAEHPDVLTVPVQVTLTSGRTHSGTILVIGDELFLTGRGGAQRLFSTYGRGRGLDPMTIRLKGPNGRYTRLVHDSTQTWRIAHLGGRRVVDEALAGLSAAQRTFAYDVIGSGEWEDSLDALSVYARMCVD